MKIVVVFPTATEAQFFKDDRVEVELCGVGLVAAAYNTLKIIKKHSADVIILAGIAGVYSHSRYGVGDVVYVEKEYEADLGFFTPSGFTHLADLAIDMEFSAAKSWTNPLAIPASVLPSAISNSMNAAMAPFVNVEGIDIENMEGAAFFQVCLQEQQAFLEVRSISNIVDIHDDQWDMDGSIKNLAQGLTRVVNFLIDGSD